MPASKQEKPHDALGLERIVFFTDAVTAIAITLLVLDLKVPEIEPALIDTRLARQLLGQWPRYLGFLVSFWVIGVYWASHHRSFRFIRRYDRALLFQNLLFLMFIAFLPFTTSLLFTYPAELITVAFYAGTVSAIGLAKLGIWLYATRRHRLVEPTLTRPTIASIRNRLLITPAVFMLSIVVALFNPAWAMYSWPVLLPLSLIFRPLEANR